VAQGWETNLCEDAVHGCPAGTDVTVPPCLCGSEGWLSIHVLGIPLCQAREIFERDYLIAQINCFGGKISRTAAFIGMERFGAS